MYCRKLIKEETSFQDRYRIGLLTSPRISPNEFSVLLSLGRMTRNTFDLHLFCGKGQDHAELKQFYTIHTGNTFQKDMGDIRYSVNICFQHILKAKPNLLMNTCSPATIGFSTSFFANKFRIPNIVRMTGDSFAEARVHRHPWKKIKAWLLHGQMATMAYKNANIILAIGENLKKKLIAHNFDQKKIIVLPQPFDASRFKALRISEKKQKKKILGLSPDHRTILFVGRLSWLKGVDRIIKIIELIQKRSSSFQFCLLGQGELAHELKRFPPSLVQMPGLVAHRDVSQYYQAADLLIFPSRTEGLPNTILEALSCKLPVIASPVGDIPNWVSTLATDPRDYVDYLIKGDYVLDDLPDQLNFDHLKKSYTDLFQTVIREFA